MLNKRKKKPLKSTHINDADIEKKNHCSPLNNHTQEKQKPNEKKR
jgi:hypothetical protein